MMIRFRGLETIFATALAVCSLLIVDLLPAQAGQDSWMGKAVSLQGEIRVKRSGQTDWMPVQLDDRFYIGDTLHVSQNSRAAVVLRNDSVLRIDQQTTLVFQSIETKKSFLLNLIEGAAFFFSRKHHTLNVVTPFVNGVVEGTEFLMQVDGEKTEIILYEGALRAQNPYGEVIITKNQAVEARKERPPVATTRVRPRDAVQWALYYPPILAVRPDDVAARTPDDWRTRLHRSMQAYTQGDLNRAFNAIADVGKEVSDARFYIYRAGLNLSVGRIGRARQDIARALSLDAESSAAMALRSIIAVVQNRKADALKDAEIAVAMDERSAAARIALSYALQSRFELNAALAAARSATEAEPANNIAWARLAELQLSTGNLDAALNAAQNAANLPPSIAHTHSILGFAYLTRIKIDRAEKAFATAITLDSAAPLPRLGLGLAKIRRGDLKAGRAEIEIAAGLAPDNALIRSYLGKAYFEEKRSPLDQRQFEMAKSLDPKDPTPWFYDAIRKQTENRPVEALEDMQRAIELNDNRAIYRSRFMLDEDLAVKSVGLGRIYGDLSFEELALREGARSLNTDPANYSAHRLLADMYASRSRYEIAKVSELLQSQLLQPMNLAPVIPQLAESNFMFIDSCGPSTPSFNEFTPLFTRNQTAFQINGEAGEWETYAGTVALAGLHDWFSYNAGYYHHENDGWRKNNELTKDLYSTLAQLRITEKASLQLEYRYREVRNGDLRQRFDLKNFIDSLNRVRQEKIPRLGFHLKPKANHHFIASLIYNQTDQQLSYQEENPPEVEIYDRIDEVEAYSGEVQYLLNTEKSHFVLGAGHYEESYDYKRKWDYIYEGQYYPGEFERNRITSKHFNAYFYGSLNLASSLESSFGLGVDSFDRNLIHVHQWNPKLGLMWQPTSNITVRAAAIRTLKRSLVNNQTIEPTQVEGFNQFFDDPTGTDAKRYGVGVDIHVLRDLRIGGEMTFGDLTIPVENNTARTVREADRNEWCHNIYLYWPFSARWSQSFEYKYLKFTEEYEDPTDIPKSVKTQILPLTLSYFNKNGLFAKIKGQYIHQNIEQFNNENYKYTKDQDEFTTVDFQIGYRLPKRAGTVSLSINNIFDTNFSYYDSLSIQSTQTTTYRPGRQILIKTKFSF